MGAHPLHKIQPRLCLVWIQTDMHDSRGRWILISTPFSSFPPQKWLSLASRPLSSLQSKRHQDLEECKCNVLGNQEEWCYLLVHSQWSPGCSVSCAHPEEVRKFSLLPLPLFHDQRHVKATVGQCSHLSTLYQRWQCYIIWLSIVLLSKFAKLTMH